MNLCHGNQIVIPARYLACPNHKDVLTVPPFVIYWSTFAALANQTNLYSFGHGNKTTQRLELQFMAQANAACACVVATPLFSQGNI